MELIEPIDYELVEYSIRISNKKSEIYFGADNIGSIRWCFDEDKVLIANRTDNFVWRVGNYEQARDYIKKYMCIDSKPDMMPMFTPTFISSFVIQY